MENHSVIFKNKTIDFTLIRKNVRNINLRTKADMSVYAPKFCIDYVVLHELLHFENPKHDKKFYQSLTANMPDWQECKKLLDEVVIREI